MALKSVFFALAALLSCTAHVRADDAATAKAQDLYTLGQQLMTDHKPRQAMLALTQAAELGLPEAQNALGKFYLSQGSELEQMLAEKWLKAAAASGRPAFKRDLGCGLYAIREKQRAPLMHEAAEAMQDAADHGDIQAQFYLSRFSRFGIGMERSADQANVLLANALKTVLANDDKKILVDAIYFVGKTDCGPFDAAALGVVQSVEATYRREHPGELPDMVQLVPGGKN